VYQKILAAEEHLSVATQNFDEQARDLIRKLLCQNPVKRLGMLHRGFDDIWSHPFLKGEEKKRIVCERGEDMRRHFI